MEPRKTKIVATVSDLRCEEEFIAQLIEAGANVIRLNTAHQSPADSLKIIRNIRKVSDQVGILLDTKGPEIRTTKAEAPIELTEGSVVRLKGDPHCLSNVDCLCVNHAGFADDVPEGSHILIDDGNIELVVIEKKADALICRINNSGTVGSRKSINVPGVSFKLPALSDKDRDYVKFAVENDVDFIAHSFVRNKQDVLDVQAILDAHRSPIKIIAKIENQQGVDHIDEILDHAYGIMVARGDLAIEIPYEKIPGIQKMLINKAIAHRKPVIVATQMLHSMIEQPRPTRAEVSDIANAIYSKTDAIMLSGETAFGKYPIEAVRMMSKVAHETEKSRSDYHDVRPAVLTTERSAYLTKVAVDASIKLNAAAVIADSSSGNSIRNMAGYRGRKPIFAHCYDRHVVRQLSLSFGVFAELIEPRRTSDEFVRKALESHLIKGTIGPNDMVVVIAGNFGEQVGASFIEISPVVELIRSTDC